MVDPACDCRSAEPVVDVDDRDARCTAVEHAQQRRESAEARAVPDARRHRDDGNFDEPADHAWQRTFHARDDDDSACRCKTPMFPEQPVKTGNADIEQAIDRIAHYLCCHTRFFSDRQIGRTGSSDENGAAAWLHVVLTVRDGTSNGVEYRARNLLFYCGECLRGPPRDKQRMPARHNFSGDRGDLLGRFP
jgi:hypothetical protein